MVQLSYSYVTTGKTIALTIQAFVEKVMSLLFNMLSRFFLPSLLFPSLPFPSLFFLHLCPSLSLFFFLTPTCNCSQYREAKCTDEKTLLGYNLSPYKTQSPMEKLPPILWAHPLCHLGSPRIGLREPQSVMRHEECCSHPQRSDGARRGVVLSKPGESCHVSYTGTQSLPRLLQNEGLSQSLSLSSCLYGSFLN